MGDHLLFVLQINPLVVHAPVGMSAPCYTGGALRAQIKIATAQQRRSANSPAKSTPVILTKPNK